VLSRRPKENPWKEGRALRETMERSTGRCARDRFIIASSLGRVRVLIKPGLAFFSLFSGKLPGQRPLPTAVSLNPPLSSFYRARVSTRHESG